MFYLFCFAVSAQKTPINFGNVVAADFVLPVNTIIDSNASAVIIADVGNTSFKGNEKGWVSYIFKRKKRIKILNKKAFDLATVKIDLYVDGDYKERVEDISAVTYNLENGNVVSSKMVKKDVFTDKVDKNHIEQKFTLPAVKENAIIEYSYTVYSDFYNHLPGWTFQSIDYPTLWSEYETTIPILVTYIFGKKGIHPFYIDKGSNGDADYLIKSRKVGGTVDDFTSLSANTIKHRWVMKDVPSFYVENYLYSPENYIDEINFQLSKTYNGKTEEPVNNSWSKVTEDLLNDKDFAAFVSAEDDNSWIYEHLGTMVKKDTGQLQQAKDIYYYLSENFTCTSHHAKYIETNLQDVFKNKKGSVAELNLLLTNILLRDGITAAPVLLSTREYGYNFESYPFLDKLDYVICKATINNKAYYLDASHLYLAFGQLPMNCYNGHARVISKTDSGSVYFLADSIKDRQTTFVHLINDTTGKIGLIGTYENSMGNMSSYELRKLVNKTGEKQYFDAFAAASSNEIELTQTGIDSLKKIEYPLKVKVKFKINEMAKNDVIYLNPLLWNGYKTNPFSDAVRKYPIEMPAPADQSYGFIMEIPQGFKVDEVPKSVRISFNDNQGYFEYLVQKNENSVQVRSTMVLRKAYFDAEDYNSLREFFGVIVKKQAEQIVFKKVH